MEKNQKRKKKKIKKQTIRTNKLLKKGRKRIIEKSVKTESHLIELVFLVALFKSF